MIDEKDWRLRGQEEYMPKLRFKYRKYEQYIKKGDHAHCEFCWQKFMENPEAIEDCSNFGYCTIDEKYWVCEACFSDFKEQFNWSLEQ